MQNQLKDVGKGSRDLL